MVLRGVTRCTAEPWERTIPSAVGHSFWESQRWLGEPRGMSVASLRVSQGGQAAVSALGQEMWLHAVSG